jgi:hypothetical protein
MNGTVAPSSSKAMAAATCAGLAAISAASRCSMEGSMVRLTEWFGRRVARPMGEGYGLRIMPNILRPAHHRYQPFARQTMGSLIQSTWAETSPGLIAIK